MTGQSLVHLGISLVDCHLLRKNFASKLLTNFKVGMLQKSGMLCTSLAKVICLFMQTTVRNETSVRNDKSPRQKPSKFHQVRPPKCWIAHRCGQKIAQNRGFILKSDALDLPDQGPVFCNKSRVPRSPRSARWCVTLRHSLSQKHFYAPRNALLPDCHSYAPGSFMFLS